MSKEEKKNKRTGFLVSLFVHLGLLILFLFVLAWKEPFPPLPEYGIELNFGFDDSGEGKEESQNPADKVEIDEETPEEIPEDNEEEIEQEETEVQSSDEISEEIEAEAVEESTSEISATENKVSEEKSDEMVDDEKIEKEQKEVKKEEPKVLVTYKAGGDKSEGDTKGSGNMGDPEGNENSKNYDGTLGGGGGALLDLSGWKWEKPPKPDDKSDATGRIIFEVTVDSRGKIIKIKTLEKTVSPQIEKIYRDELYYKIILIRTGGGKIPNESVGKITFIIKSS